MRETLSQRTTHTTTAPVSLTTLLLIAVAAGSFLASQANAAGWLDKIRGVIDDPVQGSEALTTDEIGAGLKDALRIGTQTVVAKLGSPDGFNLDPQIHIPLPAQLDQVKVVLERIGMDATLADLELRLNRAAELATPKAKALFLNAIEGMTLEDVMGIYEGPDDSATRYFRSKMSAPLAMEMSPLVDDSLADAGVVQAYDSAMSQYNSVPFLPKVDADLSQYVVEKSMDGIFFYVAQEEAAIRRDPVKRTTELLKRVFNTGSGN